MSNSNVARAVLDKLADEDLIDVEDHDEAVEELSRALAAAPDDERVALIISFLDDSDKIDEIYGSDAELEAAIKSALAAAAA
jgi:hypothetical protein